MLRDRVRSSAGPRCHAFAFHRLGRGLGDAVRAIGAVRAARDLFLFRGAREPLHAFRERSRGLARAAALAALEEPAAPGAGALRDEAEALLADLRRELGGAAGAVPGTLEQLSDDALAHAGALLSEHALEHGAELIVGPGPSGMSLMTAAATPEQAQAWLLDALYDRVEGWAESRPLAAFERAAARWWYGRWRGAPPPPADAYPGDVREREFALVERPYLALAQVAPLAAAMEAGALADAGPRQRSLAEQLLRSVFGVWDVEWREDDRVIYVRPLDGTRLEVREHQDEPLYGPGATVLGRLIPFGDGTWLRSPGAAVLPEGQARRDFALLAAAELYSRDERIHRLAFLEATLQGLMGTVSLPRAARPDLSPELAGRMLIDYHRGMAESGILEEVTPILRSSAGPLELEVQLFEFPVDPVLEEYMDALVDLATEDPELRDALEEARERPRARRAGRARRPRGRRRG